MKILNPHRAALEITNAQKRDVRTQFGALCWRRKQGKLEFLLVTSRRSGRWIIPKGWPMGGMTPHDAASIEAWEEAGVEGQISNNCIGLYTYVKAVDREELPCVVAVFPLKVKRTKQKWPEQTQRRRAWFSKKKASKIVGEPELGRIIRNFDPRGSKT